MRLVTRKACNLALTERRVRPRHRMSLNRMIRRQSLVQRHGPCSLQFVEAPRHSPRKRHRPRLLIDLQLAMHMASHAYLLRWRQQLVRPVTGVRRVTDRAVSLRIRRVQKLIGRFRMASKAELVFRRSQVDQRSPIRARHNMAGHAPHRDRRMYVLPRVLVSMAPNALRRIRILPQRHRMLRRLRPCAQHHETQNSRTNAPRQDAPRQDVPR